MENSKTLIIAEKPSQMVEYMSVLGSFSKKDGYYESEKYLMTSCFGHLIELEEDKVYHNSPKWSLDYLPLIPGQFKYGIGKTINAKKEKNIDTGKAKRVQLIKDLASRSSQIINATDADREGELIFMYVYNYLGLNLPVLRLWVSSLQSNALVKGFKELRTPNAELTKAAYVRAQADWLIGVNATQCASLTLGQAKQVLHIGRVKSAILKIVCDRYLQFKQHTKSFTYKVIATHKLNDIYFHSESQAFETMEMAVDCHAKLKQHVVKNYTENELATPPPLLYNINTLTQDGNKLFKFSAEKTLSLAQSLYEKKLASYPRTDTEYINQENFQELKGYTSAFAKDYLGVDFKFQDHTPRCVNDAKLQSSHDAIVLTGVKPAFNTLSEDEQTLFKLILSRTLMAFHTNMKHMKKAAIFDNQGFEFKSNSSRLLDKGWSIYKYGIEEIDKEDREEEEASEDLPFMTLDEQVDVITLKQKEIASKPKPLYTEGSLIADLINMGKFLSEENRKDLAEVLKDCQIGTEATRAGIIKQLVQGNYVTIQKNKLLPTDFGLQFYQSIKNLKICDLATTAIFEKKLASVEKGEFPSEAYFEEIRDYTKEIVHDIIKQHETSPTKLAISSASHTKSMGSCPNCKKNGRQGNIIQGKFNYGCSNWKDTDTPGCKFKIPFTLASKKLSQKNVEDLLTKNKTSVIKGFVSAKNSTNFEAALELQPNSETQCLEVKFVFNNSKK